MRVSIINGQLVDPANGIDERMDVFIADGRVCGLSAAPAGFKADRTLDADGLIVCPGLIDLSARSREPGLEHKATIASEAHAAVANGITTLCTPPDTSPVVDTPAVVELIHQRAEQAATARVEVVGALTTGLAGEQLAEMGALAEAGCVAVSNALEPVRDTDIMRRALQYAATFEMTVLSRPQDPWLAAGRQVHEGAMSTRLGLAGIAATAETITLTRDLLLAEQTGARTHFLHLSSGRAVELVADAKRRGLNVSADVTVQHIHLTDAALAGFNSECHLSPPLRSEADREALREGLRSNVIDVLCSDHQPHERDARLNPFATTESGVSALDTLLPLTLELVHDGTLTLSQAIACVSTNPARVLGLDRGQLGLGASADICVFDASREFVLEAETMVSNGKNTPFIGRTLHGRTCATLVGGELVFDAT